MDVADCWLCGGPAPLDDDTCPDCREQYPGPTDPPAPPQDPTADLIRATLVAYTTPED